MQLFIFRAILSIEENIFFQEFKWLFSNKKKKVYTQLTVNVK